MGGLAVMVVGELVMPQRSYPSKVKILWGLNAVAFVLVVVCGTCSYIKHHPEIMDQHLAMSSKTSAVAHHGNLGSTHVKSVHQKTSAHHEAHADARKMNLKGEVTANKMPLDQSAQAHAPPTHQSGGILPQIPVKYLPFVIVGFMLAVPVLTVAVLKGCWAIIDMFVPPVGAGNPDNYATRKLKQEQNPDPEMEVEVCTK